MSQEIGKKIFNVQNPPKTYLWPICSGFRTFWDLQKWFWVLPQLNFGAKGQESCQNGQFCIFLISGLPKLQITFFMVQMCLDGFIWRGLVHMKALKCRRGQIWSKQPVVMYLKNQVWMDGMCLWGPKSKNACQKFLSKPIFSKGLHI